MIHFIVFVLTVGLFLYAFLAGADFGAGILQMLPIGISREEKTQLIGKAVGPVWEANHVWLILALVIAFNGFPQLFWFISEYFHFPLGAFVIGIIFRGASFTFLHYDPIRDKSEKVYHWIFGLSSLWCTMWIGFIIGSLMLGNFSLTDTDIYPRYFAHWLNPFSLMMGIFITVLMMFNASLFLYLEATQNKEKWLRVTISVLAMLVFAGLVLHLIFYMQSPERWKIFFSNPMSIGLISISLVLLFPQYLLIQYNMRKFSRSLAGAQLILIVGAGFAPHYPKIIVMRDGTFLDFPGTAAEPYVLKLLSWALLFGCLIILPSYFYLLKTFKSQRERLERDVESAPDEINNQ